MYPSSGSRVRTKADRRDIVMDTDTKLYRKCRIRGWSNQIFRGISFDRRTRRDPSWKF